MEYTETREEITAKVKDQSDIVQIIGECVELKKSGIRYLGLCPFHGEKTPSFSVHSGQQFFYCFGCGESGDVFSFMMKYYNLDFPNAVKELARRYQIELPERTVSPVEQKQKQLRQLLFEVNKKAARAFSDFLTHSQKSGQARAYLEKRGIPNGIQAKYGLGYAPSVEAEGWDFLQKKLSAKEIEAAGITGLLVKKETGGWYDRFRDRIMFPIQDVRGRVCGFGGRIVGDGQPKYMNSPESQVFNKGQSLLGLYQQQDTIRKKNRVVLVEGNFDLISLVVHGCENVVAPLGTALTQAQIRLLHRYSEEAILLFDGDEAGLKAAERSVPLFFAEKVRARVALLPGGHDPDTFVQEHGLSSLQDLLDGAEALPEFVLDQLIKKHGLGLDGKSRIVEALRPLVRAAASTLQRSVVIAHFSEKLAIPVEQLAASLSGDIKGSPPPVSVKGPPQPTETFRPLSSAQNHLVRYMLLNSSEFLRLEEAGLRDALAGGIGEVIFLQMKLLLQDKQDIEPEEILSHLPEGGERVLVTELLLKASSIEFNDIGSDARPGESEEVICWLKREQLQKRSGRIVREITLAQEKNDFLTLQQLLREKQDIERELRNS